MLEGEIQDKEDGGKIQKCGRESEHKEQSRICDSRRSG